MLCLRPTPHRKRHNRVSSTIGFSLKCTTSTLISDTQHTELKKRFLSDTHSLTPLALLFQPLNTLLWTKGFTLKWTYTTSTLISATQFTLSSTKDLSLKHTFQHYSTSISGIQHNFHQPQPHFFILDDLTHTALLCRVSGLWPVTVLLHLFQVCKLLQVVFGDLVVHHHPDGKIPHDYFADHKQGLDDVNSSLHWKQQSVGVEEKEDDEGQLKNHGQKPKACQLWHLRGRTRKYPRISFFQVCNRWMFNHFCCHLKLSLMYAQP